MKLASRINRIETSKTLQVKEKALELKAQGIEVIDLTAGEPDFPTPPSVCQAGIEAIQQGFTKYTANNGIPELRTKIAQKFARDNNLSYTPEQIIVSSGAKQSILNALLVMVEEGDEVIIGSPYWVSYPEQIKIAGASPVIIDTATTDFKIQPRQLEQNISSRTKAVILNSPCNPTGVVYTEPEIRDLADILLQKDIWIISDEIYEKIIFDHLHHISVATFGNLIEKSVVINGFSKSYSMTGWRLGYAAGPLAVVKAMSKIQSHYTSNASSISQKAAVAALNGPSEEIEKMRRVFEERRNYIKSVLDKRSYFSYVYPQGAFYFFIDISAVFGSRGGEKMIENSLDVCSFLTEHYHLVTVPGIAFGDDRHLRISFAASQESLEIGMRKLTEAMDHLMERK